MYQMEEVAHLSFEQDEQVTVQRAVEQKSDVVILRLLSPFQVFVVVATHFRFEELPQERKEFGVEGFDDLPERAVDPGRRGSGILLPFLRYLDDGEGIRERRFRMMRRPRYVAVEVGFDVALRRPARQRADAQGHDERHAAPSTAATVYRLVPQTDEGVLQQLERRRGVQSLSNAVFAQKVKGNLQKFRG